MGSTDRKRHPEFDLLRTMRAYIIVVFGIICMFLSSSVRAQDGSVDVELTISRAQDLYNESYLDSTLRVLQGLADAKEGDKDQWGRILFLKAVTEARQDSIKAMRRSVEQLFRVDRNYVMKPYDPLIVDLAVRDELYGTYLGLAGGRDVGPGLMQKDQGKWRMGVSGGVVHMLLDVRSNTQVFAEDGQNSYDAPLGWELAGTMEYDLIPNLAIQASGGYSVTRYRTRNEALRYEEELTSIPLSLALKKMFWFSRSPWVPYVSAGATYAWLDAAQATVERSGDGVRLLAPLRVDRAAERERDQWRLSGALGLSRKVGHTVIHVECRYDHALSDLTLDVGPYTDSETLLRYYYVDNPIRLSSVVVSAGLQYIIRYHSRNRIYK